MLALWTTDVVPTASLRGCGDAARILASTSLNALAHPASCRVPLTIRTGPRFPRVRPSHVTGVSPAHSRASPTKVGSVRLASAKQGATKNATESAASSITEGASKMKIAVVGGTGNVGSKLALKLCSAGHDVVLTSRHPDDEKTTKALEYVRGEGKGTATAAGIAEAVEGSDAVIVATPGYATAEEWSKVVAPFASYSGVVLDASNPLSAWPELELNSDQNSTSGGEELKKALPNAHVFKAFNTIGVEIMLNPVLGGRPVALLFAGSGDAAAKDTASKVISAVGFRPEYVGPLRYARNLESMAELWIHMALKSGWTRGGFAFDIQKA